MNKTQSREIYNQFEIINLQKIKKKGSADIDL